MVFKSKSSVNLPLNPQRDIKSKSTTNVAQIPVEERDDSITALPPPPAIPGPRKYKTSDLIASLLNFVGSEEALEALPDQTLQRSKSMDDLNVGDKKVSVWRRFVKALKKPFRGKKKPKIQKRLVIGAPSDFQHVQTGSACLTRPSPNEDTAEGNAEDWETIRASESFNA